MSDEHNHIIKMPLWFWILKIVQFGLSVLLLGLSAYCVHTAALNASAFMVFASLFSMLILAYYFISIHFVHFIYNWIAVLVLECIATVFWLSAWAAQAAIYAAGIGYYNSYYSDYFKRSLEKRYRYYSGGYSSSDYDSSDYTDSWNAYYGVFKATIGFGVIIFITYLVTLVFYGLAVHTHRTSGMPMVAGGAVTDVEKNTGAAPVAAAPVPVPEQQYGAPQPQYGAPQPQYGAPPAEYAQPQPGYDQQYVSPPSTVASHPPYQQSGSPPPPNNVHEAM